MRLAIALLAVALFSSPAIADSADSPSDRPPPPAQTGESPSSTTRPTEEPLGLAVAVNTPLGWANGIGVSGYFGFANRHAVRLNFALWAYKPNPVMPLVATIAGNDWEDTASYDGHTADLGIGYQFYLRRMFEGLTLEAGVFRRQLDTRVEDEEAFPNIRETKSVGYAARALVGWSWLWRNRLLVATAAGASVGRFAGTERTANDDSPDPIMYMTRDFARYETAFEAYFRIGLAFGM